MVNHNRVEDAHEIIHSTDVDSDLRLNAHVSLKHLVKQLRALVTRGVIWRDLTAVKLQVNNVYV